MIYVSNAAFLRKPSWNLRFDRSWGRESRKFILPAGKKRRILSRDLSPWVNQASNTGTGLDLRGQS